MELMLAGSDTTNRKKSVSDFNDRMDSCDIRESELTIHPTIRDTRREMERDESKRKECL